MDESKVLEVTKEVATEILNKHLGIAEELKLEYVQEEERPSLVKISFSGEDLGVLIGQRGSNLFSLQRIISLIVTKRLDEKVSIDLDINEYKSRKVKNLEELAFKASQQVIDFGVEVSLDPMSPAERRIIHMALANDERVTTESAGEDYSRHVVIRPAKN